MHWTLFVFKKKDETIDENALLEAFNEATNMGADYVRPMPTKDYKREGEGLEACRKSVTELKPAVNYLEDVKEGLLTATENFNPSIATESPNVEDIDLLKAFFYEIDDWKGNWFAISYGNGEFGFCRRTELAIKVITRNKYYTDTVKDMELVPYDFHY